MIIKNTFSTNIVKEYILLIFFAIYCYFVISFNVKYLNAFDFIWGDSINLGYANIFKSYFFDFFNSFFLYDSELGFDHSYYVWSHLNPFNFLSFFGFEKYVVSISNIFAIFCAVLFLLKISNILKLTKIKKYFLVLYPVTFIGFFHYTFNGPFFNDFMFLWVYVLFYFELIHGKINYKFYIFFFIFSALTSTYYLILELVIVLLILIFFYQYKKEHKKDLIFLFISNLLIWSPVIMPNFIAKSDAANINIFTPFLLTLFVIIIYLLRVRINFLLKLLKKKILENNFLRLLIISIFISFLLYLFYLFHKSDYYLFELFGGLFKMGRLYSFLIDHNQFELFSQVRIGSAIFMYIPFGLLIFNIINYQKKTQLLKILILILVVFILVTFFYNSEFARTNFKMVNIRYHLSYIPLIVMMFIYFNLFSIVESKKPETYFNLKNFNNNLMLFPALALDLIMVKVSYLYGGPSEYIKPYIYILLLYLPFVSIFFQKIHNKELLSIILIFVFFFLKPIMNSQIIEDIARHPEKDYFNIPQYNSAMKCLRTKSDYEKFDRVLATGVYSTPRNYIAINAMLLERERGTDLNFLYIYREIMHPKLINTFRNTLDKYKYYGTAIFPPAFYNGNKGEYFFDESFFDNLGINIAIVFNDTEKKFNKYKSFLYKGECTNPTHTFDIYKSIKPRGVALFESKGNTVKLKNISKNTWKIPNIANPEKGNFVIRLADFNKTSLYIDGKKVFFKVIDGKITAPYKKGTELKIVYQNDYHRMIFIMTMIKYFLIILISFEYLKKLYWRRF